jgi:salicylate synthase
MPGPAVLDGRRYAEARLPLRMDPVVAGAELARCTEGSFALHERPGEVSVGFGAEVEVVVTADEIRYRGPGGPVSVSVSDEPLHQVGELLAGCGIEDWRAYGWLGFELSYLRAGLPEVPGNLVLAHFVVPAQEVRLRAGGARLRALRWEGLSELHRRLEGLRDPGECAADPTLVDDVTDHDGYRAAVAAAVADIRRRRLRKVVLSRVVPVRGPIDLAASYRAGRRANTPVRSFLLRLGDVEAAGYSPETVVEAHGDGTVTSQPLAGTRGLTGDDVCDAALGEELLSDAKEVFEHAVSVRGAQDEMREVCAAGSVRVEDFMAVGRRGSAQHLASRVAGRLAEGRSGWHALARMFPAVTVSGLPKPEAYRAIRRYESEARGLYGGAVVIADADGGLDAAVVLRSVYRSGGRTWLRAGGGVVADSDPDREFEETREKLRSVARFLVPEAPAGAWVNRAEHPRSA